MRESWSRPSSIIGISAVLGAVACGCRQPWRLLLEAARFHRWLIQTPPDRTAAGGGIIWITRSYRVRNLRDIGAVVRRPGWHWLHAGLTRQVRWHPCRRSLQEVSIVLMIARGPGTSDFPASSSLRRAAPQPRRKSSLYVTTSSNIPHLYPSRARCAQDCRWHPRDQRRMRTSTPRQVNSSHPGANDRERSALP